MMGKIVTFGEIMMRLNPQGYLRLEQADRFFATYAGAEASVTVSLSNYGDQASFVSKVPDNPIGQNAVNALRHFGVDTSMVLRGGERLGIYFVEKGDSQRPSRVFYDRKYSSLATADATEFDWHAVFCGASWFHFTGITPALSEEMSKACFDACRIAKEMGLMVSCDLNYRNKLWSKERAGETMSRLVPFVDVLIANEEDAADVFGIKAKGTDVRTGEIDKNGYVDVARRLQDRFGCKRIAFTLRGSLSASDNTWGGMLYADDKAYFSKTYLIHLVDRVGGGDSFGAGLIHAITAGLPSQDAIEFAVAASCLKQTIENDFNLVSVDEVERLARGDACGRVQR